MEIKNTPLSPHVTTSIIFLKFRSDLAIICSEILCDFPVLWESRTPCGLLAWREDLPLSAFCGALHLIPIMVPWKECLWPLCNLVKQEQYTPPQGLCIDRIKWSDIWKCLAYNRYQSIHGSVFFTVLHLLFGPLWACMSFHSPKFLLHALFAVSHVSPESPTCLYKNEMNTQDIPQIVLSETILTPPGDLILFYASM